jgi:hypothetical protein
VDLRQMPRSRPWNRSPFGNIISVNVSRLSMDKSDPLRDSPNCIKCGEKMLFSCTEIEKTGFVHRVYECKKCRSTQSFVTAK